MPKITHIHVDILLVCFTKRNILKTINENWDTYFFSAVYLLMLPQVRYRMKVTHSRLKVLYYKCHILLMFQAKDARSGLVPMIKHYTF